MTKKLLIADDYVLIVEVWVVIAAVQGIDDAFSKIKFKIPPFDGKYDIDAYITREIVVDQKVACHEFYESTLVRATTSEFTEFASVWWIEHGNKNPNNMPQTWDDLKESC